jgi:hypothetical protein
MTAVTRRAFFLFTGPAAVAQSLADRTRNSEIATESDDTWIRLISDKDPNVFFVGVRSSIEAEYALVTVFYNLHLHTASGNTKFLVSKESMAPVAGIRGYGATRDQFSIPRDLLDFVQVTFLNQVAQRKST